MLSFFIADIRTNFWDSLGRFIIMMSQSEMISYSVDAIKCQGNWVQVKCQYPFTGASEKSKRNFVLGKFIKIGDMILGMISELFLSVQLK